jgi:hypothetical protein
VLDGTWRFRYAEQADGALDFVEPGFNDAGHNGIRTASYGPGCYLSTRNCSFALSSAAGLCRSGRVSTAS